MPRNRSGSRQSGLADGGADPLVAQEAVADRMALLVRGVVEAAAGVEDALEPCVLALLQVKRYRDGVKQGFGSRQPLFVDLSVDVASTSLSPV